MRELFNEVFASMRSNLMRIGLTGFAIAWGMFILVVLLGASGGFQRGLFKTFHLDKDQIVRITVDKTSIPWNGLDKGRQLHLYLNDVDALNSAKSPYISSIAPYAMMSLPVVSGNINVQTPVTGCYAGYLPNDFRTLVGGRDINLSDVNEQKKVCVINTRLARQLFADQDALGRFIDINGSQYQVVGLCNSSTSEDMSFATYVPLSTMMTIYRPQGKIDGINIVVKGLYNAEKNEFFSLQIQEQLALLHECSPKDSKAIKVVNSYEQVLSTKSMIYGIGIFVWVIGLATLIAGIVGVSNIMMITVKERTKELGVRRAMGAQNSHIISLVLIEAVMITMTFGYIGMMLGVGLMQLLDAALGSSFAMFQNPTVQFWALMGCAVIIILAGMLAGYIPARRAINIKLVDALTG